MSFGKPESTEVAEEETLSPGMVQIIGRLEQQEKRFVIHCARNKMNTIAYLTIIRQRGREYELRWLVIFHTRFRV